MAAIFHQLILIVTAVVAACVGGLCVASRGHHSYGRRQARLIVTAGQGTPAVVFEHGLGGTFDLWQKVFPEVAKVDTAFAYDRPGTGGSDRASTSRDGEQIVNELRVLLAAEGIGPPYVLVGLSLGGLYMQLFARRYPREVARLVLVDPTHPDQFNGAGAQGTGRPGSVSFSASLLRTPPNANLTR